MSERLNKGGKQYLYSFRRLFREREKWLSCASWRRLQPGKAVAKNGTKSSQHLNMNDVVVIGRTLRGPWQDDRVRHVARLENENPRLKKLRVSRVRSKVCARMISGILATAQGHTRQQCVMSSLVVTVNPRLRHHNANTILFKLPVCQVM